MESGINADILVLENTISKIKMQTALVRNVDVDSVMLQKMFNYLRRSLMMEKENLIK